MRIVWGLLAALLASPLPAEDYPVSIDTRFGTATIEAPPQRVVSIGYITQDFLLALGVKPIAVREWYGQKPYATWEWAQDELEGAQPVVLAGEINIEQIAALRPDLIVAYWSGVTARDYALLNKIAPTLAPAAGEGAYGTSWQDMLLNIGRATGHEPEARAIITRLDHRLAEIRTDHPEWQGKELAIAWPGNIGAYTDKDIRGQLTQSLGLSVPAAFDGLSGPNPFYVLIPAEDLSAIDADALIWVDTGDTPELFQKIPLRKTLRAHHQGREIYADAELSGALSFSSPLSLDYALDRLVPLLEAALDGDPATPVATSVAAGLAP